MKKQKQNILKKATALIIILLVVFMPTISTANSSTVIKDYSSILSVIAQRYRELRNYKEYLSEINEAIIGINNTIPVKEAKIKIISETTKLQKSYGNSTVVPKISNQIAYTASNSEAETTTDLLTEIVEKVKSLLTNANLAMQSFTPDIVVDNMKANTAGDLHGEKYRVNLSGKIYYADIDENKQPISNKWVVLLHGVLMNGQAMADAVGEMYIDRGYNILAIDSRGHGDSDGSVAMGYLESLDVWDWLTYLNKEYACDNIIIHGVSLGGATTVFTSGLEVNGKTLKQQNVIGLIEDCGYTSLTGIIKGMLGGSSADAEVVEKTDAELAEKKTGIEGLVELLTGQELVDSLIKTVLINAVDVGLTEENFDTYQNGLKSLNNCELPLLIIHGTSDTTVPFENSDTIYQTALENDKIPYVQRFKAEKEPHAFITIGSQENVYEGHVENFIKTAELIDNGEKVNKVSNYKEEEEQEASLMSSLIKALKLIKNLMG